MGLMDFVKSAGSAIFGSDEEEKQIEAEVQAQADAQRDKLEKLKKARALQMKVDALGLDIENASFRVEGSTVILGGKVADQADLREDRPRRRQRRRHRRGRQPPRGENTEPEAQYHTVVSGDTSGEHRQEVLRQRRQVPRDLRGQQADAQGPGQDLPGPGAADSGSGRLRPKPDQAFQRRGRRRAARHRGGSSLGTRE